jgi:hypothetical protein
MKAIIVLALAMGLLSASNATSDTIYTWTDAKGIQRFSNTPPQGVENYKQIESQAVRPDSPEASDQRRSSYDQMVQHATEEYRQLDQQRRAKEAARIAKEKRLAEKRRQAKIESERRRLLEQIEAIKNRAVSPTYPQGMKQAQIDKIQKQIDALENNPDADASPKKEKSAESKSGY